MAASRVAAAVSTLLWLLMTVTGISGIVGIRDQHLPGYPNAGQIGLYVAIPVLGFSCCAAILCFAKKLPGWAKGVALTILFVALLPVLLMFGGGV